MNKLDSFIFKTHYTIDKIIMALSKNRKSDLTDYIQILNKNTLLSDASNIASTIEITGIIGSVDNKLEQNIINNMANILDDYLKTGTQFDVRYLLNSQNPLLLEKNLERLRSADENMQLGLDSNIKSLGNKITKYLINERIFLTIYSSPAIVDAQILKKHNTNLKKVKYGPSGEQALNDYAKNISDTQLQNHYATVEAVLGKISRFSYAKLLTAEDSLKILREVLFDSPQSHWNLITQDDSPSAFTYNDIENKNSDKADASLLLPPPLATQLLPRVENINSEVYKINDLYYSAIEIQIFPIKAVRFESLKTLIVNKKISANINFTLLPNGFDAIGGNFKEKMASFTGSISLSEESKYLSAVLRNAKTERNSTAIQCDISFFAKTIKDLEISKSILNKFIVGWGGALPESPGDPLRAILSSLGLKRVSNAPKACAVPTELSRLLPLVTTKKPFDYGNILLRTKNGHIYPFSTVMDRQSGAIMVYGPMGYAKSVFLGQIVKSVVNDAALKSNRLPKIAFIDIAKSPSGIFPYLKNAVRQDIKNEIAYSRLTMSVNNNINPLDTILGMRVPIVEQINSIKGIFSLFTIDNVDDKIQDGVTGVLEFAIKKSYEDKAEKSANLYQHGISIDVDTIIDDSDIELDEHSTWWEIVDYLFDKDFKDAATIAQRFAVPLISDVISTVRSPEAAAVYSFKTATDEALIDFVVRKLTEASQAYPILTKPSTISSTARISYINLNDVSPSNAKKQTAIMYLLARMVLVKDWMLNWDSLEPLLEERYKDFYKQKIEADIGVPKVIIYDEFHRTGGIKLILDQVETDIREGPKFSWFVVLSTQKIQDLTETMSSLSSSAFILGGSSKSEQETTKKIFGLKDAELALMNGLSKPDVDGAELLLWLNHGDKRYVQKLVSTLPTEDLWILNSNANESSVRDELYKRFGVTETIRLLTKFYPNVSFDEQMAKIQSTLKENDDVSSDIITILIKQIVQKFEESLSE